MMKTDSELSLEAQTLGFKVIDLWLKRIQQALKLSIQQQM
jgi:hypothetical protein